MLIGLLIAALAPFMSSQFHLGGSIGLLLLAALLPILRGIASPAYFIVTRQRGFQKLAGVETSAAFIDCAIGLVCALGGAGAYSVLIGLLAAELLKSTLTWTTMSPRPPIRLAFSGIGHYVNFSRWIWAGSVVNLLLNQFDKVIVAKLLGPLQLGAYQMSSKLAQMLLADAAIAMSQYLFPTFSEHHRSDVHAAQRMFRRYLALAAVGLAVLVIVLRFAAQPLFEFVLGPAWLPAVPLFRIFVINMAIGAVIAVLVSWLRAVGMPKVATHASIIQAVVLLRDGSGGDASLGRHRHRVGDDGGAGIGGGLDAFSYRQGGVMRILHLVLAPRLSGAEVLAKDLAIHQQRGGETVGVTALTPPQADFAALQAELVANGVQCLFPQAHVRPRRKVVEPLPDRQGLSRRRPVRPRDDPGVLCPRVADQRARRVRDAFRDQRLRARVCSGASSACCRGARAR